MHSRVSTPKLLGSQYNQKSSKGRSEDSELSLTYRQSFTAKSRRTWVSQIKNLRPWLEIDDFSKLQAAQGTPRQTPFFIFLSGQLTSAGSTTCLIPRQTSSFLVVEAGDAPSNIWKPLYIFFISFSNLMKMLGRQLVLFNHLTTTGDNRSRSQLGYNFSQSGKRVSICQLLIIIISSTDPFLMWPKPYFSRSVFLRYRRSQEKLFR